MAITATFAADFTAWNTALKNAQTNLKSFEVSTKNVGQQLQRAFSTFSGQKVIRDANLAVAAVEKLGGAAKLTASEQARLNATLTEALAKYKALGQVAPKEMQDLANATKQVVAPTEAATASVGALALKYVSIGAAIALATKAIGGLVDFLSSSVTSYAQAEAAQNRMVAALRAQGTATPAVIKQYTELAATIQRTTAFSDDAAAEMISLFTSIGRVAPAEMGKATKAATDLAAGLGIDLAQAATLVAKAMEGNTGALGRYGIKLDQAKIAAEGADAIFGAINERFGGQAVSQLDTYAGRLANITNLWDDFKEAVGKAIVEDESIQQLMRDAPAIIQGMTTAIGLFAEGIRVAHQSWKDFQNAISFGAFSAKEQFLEMRDAALEAKIAMDLLGRETPMAGTLRDIELLPPALAAIGPKALEAGETLDQLDADLRKITVSQIAASKAAEDFAKAVTDLRKEITGGKLLTSIKQMAAAWSGLTKSQKDSAPVVAALAKFYDALGPNLAELPPELRGIVKEGEDASRAVGALADEYQSVREEVSKLDLILDRLELAADAEEARQVLQDIGAELGLVGRRIEEAFDLGDQLDATIADIRGVDNAIQEMFEAVDTQDESFGAKLGGNLKKNLLDSVAGIPEIITQGILHDASWEEMAIAIATTIGAAIGSAIGFALAGPAGAQIGAALGSLLGPLLDAVWETRAEETQQRIREEFGVSISEGLAQAIEDAAADFAGNREAAKLFNLDRIIAEGGGLTVDNIDEMFARLHDVYSQMETGAFNAADAQKVLNENFKTFADFVTHDGALASRELLEIIRLNNEMGTQSAAVAEFVTAQVTSALGGLTQFLENAEVTSQAAAQGIAASVFGAFEALTQQGATPLEAIKQITPVLEQLDAQLKAAGFSGGAAFDQLRAMAALANDEIRGPMIEAISGLGTALEGLHNSGVLNQEMFAGLATQITDTYNKLIAQGTDGAQALQLTGESLQTLWELQQDFGYAVDDATQKLLDEAKAAGVVGDEHRSVQERMLLAMDRTAEAVEALAHLFGAELPSEIAKTAEAIEKIPTDVDIKVGYNVEDLPPNAVPIDGAGAAGGRPTDTGLLGADEAAQIPQRILDAMDAATPEMQAQIDLWLAEFDRFEQESGEHADAIPTKYLDAMEDATPEMQEQYKNWLAIAEGAVNDTGDIFAGLPDDINRGCWTPILREGDVVFAGIEDAAYDASHGVVDQFTEASRRTREALDKIPDDLHIKVNYDVERLPDAGFGTGGSGSRTPDELRAGAIHLANGGPVYAAQGMFVPRGTDTVPAMLTPGEVVLPREVVSALRSSATTPAVTVHLTFQTLDGADVDRVVRSPEFRRALTSAIAGNVGGYRTDIRSAIGVR